MKRYDLTDFEWGVIQPLLPNKPRGVPRVDDRHVLNGASSGCSDPALPGATCCNRFNRWRKKGIWDRLMDGIVEACDGNMQMIDSSSVRVHQHAAGSNKGSPDRCMGRSRGGLTTKIHTMVDAGGLPPRFAPSPGQAHDSRRAAPLLDNRLPPDSFVLGDKACGAEWIRTMIEAQDAVPIIPSRCSANAPRAFSPTLYRMRNQVEHFFDKLKQLRRIATRHDKRAANDLVMIKIATIRIPLRAYKSTA